MRKTTLVLLVAAGGALAACAGETPRYPAAPIPRYAPPAALPPAPTLGPATLVGRMALPRPGAAWSCEGQSAVLLPATASTIQRMQGLYGSTVAAVLPVETVRRHAAAVADGTPAEPPVASATCTDQGGFTLSGVRPGAYYLVARARLRGGATVENYALMRRVDLRPAETVVVTLPDGGVAPARRAAPGRPRTTGKSRVPRALTPAPAAKPRF